MNWYHYAKQITGKSVVAFLPQQTRQHGTYQIDTNSVSSNNDTKTGPGPATVSVTNSLNDPDKVGPLYQTIEESLGDQLHQEDKNNMNPMNPAIQKKLNQARELSGGTDRGMQNPAAALNQADPINTIREKSPKVQEGMGGVGGSGYNNPGVGTGQFS